MHLQYLKNHVCDKIQGYLKFMKKIIALAFLITILSNSITVHAISMSSSPDFSEIFDEHGAIMMFIYPDTGDILYGK